MNGKVESYAKPTITSINFYRRKKKTVNKGFHARISLRASSPLWVRKASLARTRERAAKPRGAEERRACNDLP